MSFVFTSCGAARKGAFTIGSLILLISLAADCRAEAFDYLKQAMAKLVAQSELINVADYDYDGLGCMFGYFLEPGKESSMRRDFSEDESYIIMGCGDEDIKDLDIRIADESGDKLAEDNDTDNTPLVQFTAPRSGKYTIVLTNAKAARASFCAFVILRKVRNGHVQIRQIGEALDRAIKLSQLKGLEAKEFPPGLILMGGKYRAGQGNETYDLAFDEGDYSLIVAGSENVNDADATVVRQSRPGDTAGKTISEDSDGAAVALCDFLSNGRSYYCIRIKNAASSGAGFVFGIILKN
jgi:hypothetical protein